LEAEGGGGRLIQFGGGGGGGGYFLLAVAPKGRSYSPSRGKRNCNLVEKRRLRGKSSKLKLTARDSIPLNQWGIILIAERRKKKTLPALVKRRGGIERLLKLGRRRKGEKGKLRLILDHCCTDKEKRKKFREGAKRRENLMKEEGKGESLSTFSRSQCM